MHMIHDDPVNPPVESCRKTSPSCRIMQENQQPPARLCFSSSGELLEGG